MRTKNVINSRPLVNKPTKDQLRNTYRMMMNLSSLILGLSAKVKSLYDPSLSLKHKIDNIDHMRLRILETDRQLMAMDEELLKLREKLKDSS